MRFRRLYPAILLLTLGLGAPARATTTVDSTNSPFIIDANNSPFTDDITVNPGGELDIVTDGALSQSVSFGTAVHVEGGTFVMTGGQITSAGFGVVVDSGSATISGGEIAHTHFDALTVKGGSATISGGSVTSAAGNGAVSVSGGTATITGGTIDGFTGPGVGLLVDGGTATVSGGSVRGINDGLLVKSGTATVSGGGVNGYGATGVGMQVEGGAATLSGGSVSGVGPDLVITAGTLTVVGCDLVFAGGQLTGILADRTLISAAASVAGPGVLDLQNANTGLPQITCPANVTVAATSASGAVVNYPPPTVANVCGSMTVVCSPASGSLFPVGSNTVTCRATDGLGHAGSCQFTVTVLPIADLSLGITAGASTVKSGSNLTYTILAQNSGPFTANGVVVNDPVPSGSVFVSATPNSNAGTLTIPPAGGGGSVSWNVGDLISGQSVTLTVVVRVTQKGNSTISNTATVTSSTAESNPANNSATVQSKVTGNSH